MLSDSPVTWFLGLILVARLAEMTIARRNAEALVADGAKEDEQDLHLWTSLFHALWLTILAMAMDEHAPASIGWMLAGLLLIVVRLLRIRALGTQWVWRLLRHPKLVPDPDPRRRLLRDPHFLPLAAELLVLPLAVGVWWLALPGLAVYAMLATARIQAERRP